MLKGYDMYDSILEGLLSQGFMIGADGKMLFGDEEEEEQKSESYDKWFAKHSKEANRSLDSIIPSYLASALAEGRGQQGDVMSSLAIQRAIAKWNEQKEKYKNQI